MRVNQQPAYVLINRPYSETSWIVELFTRDYGRLSVIAKGARRLKSKVRGVLLPFQPLLVSWSGKGEMPTLTNAEIDIELIELQGDARICGFYCNELLVNLLHRHDPHPGLFKDYHELIMQFQSQQADSDAGLLIRGFEQQLIKEIGYGINFSYQANSRLPIESDEYYYFEQSSGFLLCDARHPKAVQGQVIIGLADASKNLSPAQMAMAKQVMRDIIKKILGSKKITSRSLFFPKLR